MPLSVKRAPEPGDILWENRTTSFAERRLRAAVSNLVSLLLIVVSFTLLFFAQSFNSDAQSALPTESECNDLAKALGSNSTFRAVRGDDDECDRKMYSLNVTGQNNARIAALNNISDKVLGRCISPCVPLPMSSENGDDSVCSIAYDDDELSVTTFRPSLRISCYCTMKLNDFLSDDSKDGFKFYEEDGEICQPIIWGLATSSALMVVGSSAVLFINSALAWSINKLTRFEHHHSMSAERSSATSKIFLAQIFNLAIIIILVNAKLPGIFQNALFQSFGLFTGQYDDVDSSWYSVVGASICFTMLLNVFQPKLVTMGKLCIFRCCTQRKKLCQRSKVHQRQLENAMTPPSFNLADKQSALKVVIFATLIYSSGVPLLVPMAALSMLLTYIVDKYMVLRFCVQPPQYDSSMARAFVASLPWAIFLHSALAIWTFSSTDRFDPGISFLFPNSDTKRDSLSLRNIIARASKSAVLPHTCILLFIGSVGLYNGLLGWVIDPVLHDVKKRCCRKRPTATATVAPQAPESENVEGAALKSLGKVRLLDGAPSFEGTFKRYIDPDIDRDHDATIKESGNGWTCRLDEKLGIHYDCCQPENSPAPLSTYKVLASASGVSGYGMESNPKYAPAAKMLALVKDLLANEGTLEENDSTETPQTVDAFEHVLQLDFNPHMAVQESVGIQPLHIKSSRKREKAAEDEEQGEKKVKIGTPSFGAAASAYKV